MNKIKVLWLTNTPCNGIKHLNNTTTGGGWLSALQDQLASTNIELGVAFHWSADIDFDFEGVKYWAVKKSLKRRVYNFLPFINYDLSNELSSFVSIAKDFKPDVIHIHGTEQEYGLIQNLLPDIPTVISIQGSPVVYCQKYYSGIQRQFISRKQYIRSMYFKSYNTHFERFKRTGDVEKRILSDAKYIIGRTQWDHYLTNALAPHAQYFHCDEIIRSSFYSKRCISKGNTKLKLLTVIRPNLYKGLESILSTSQILYDRGIDFEWKVAGISKHDRLVRLTEQYCSVKSENVGIEYLGDVDEENLSNLLCDSSIYIQTSHIENSPNAVCEAMLVETPIIATFAGGTISLLDNRYGTIVQAGDAIAMAGAIMSVHKDYDNAKIKALKGREIAMKRHDKSVITASILDIYHNLANN